MSNGTTTTTTPGVAEQIIQAFKTGELQAILPVIQDASAQIIANPPDLSSPVGQQQAAGLVFLEAAKVLSNQTKVEQNVAVSVYNLATAALQHLNPTTPPPAPAA